MVHEAGAADVRGLWASGVGNGGHDLPGYTDAVGTLVPSDLVGETACPGRSR